MELTSRDRSPSTTRVPGTETEKPLGHFGNKFQTKNNQYL